MNMSSAAPSSRQVPARDQETEDRATKIKAVYYAFLENLENIKKDYRQQMYLIIKDIDEKKIKDLKERLKNI